MKKYNVIWTLIAKYDLKKIIEYIAISSTPNAKKNLQEIKKVCEELFYMPQRKRLVPELEMLGIMKYREVIYKRWRIIFTIQENTIFILLVVDISRNFEDIIMQRLLNEEK